MKKTLFLTLLSLVAGSVTKTALAQAAPAATPAAAPAKLDPAQLALKYAGVLETNRKKLSGYSWQNRVEVSKADVPQYVDLVEARYDASGKLQTTQVNHDLLIKQRHGLLLAKGQEDNLQELDQKVKAMRNTILAYIYMSRGNVVDFFDSATVAPAQGYNNVVRVHGFNVLAQGDAVTLYADKTSLSPLRLVFSTRLNAETRVTATVDFRHLRNNAAFIPSKVKATFKNEDDDAVEVSVESFDFLKQL